MKSFNLSTRVRISIVTIVVVVFYVLTINVDLAGTLGFKFQLNFDPVKHILLAIILYFGTYWALFFKIGRERFLTILLFPALAVISGTFISELMLNYVFPSGVGQVTFEIFTVFLVGLFTYISILTVNILNAHYLSNIPLGQAAKASYFVLSLLTSFIIYFILLGNDIDIGIKAGLMFLFTDLISYMCLWSIEYKRKERAVVAFAIALLITTGQLILTPWPINATYIALTLNLVFYLVLNIAMEMREILSKWIWIEYAILITFMLIVLILLGEWGINGALVLGN